MLTEKRKADRETMFRLVNELAAQLDVEVTEDYDVDREIGAHYTTKRGLSLHLCFDGHNCQHDVYVLGWHMHYSSKGRLADAFLPGHVNTHHRQKATSVCEGFDALRTELKRCWEMSNDGTAFLEN